MFSRGAAKKHLVVVVDIESGAAGVALVQIIPGAPAEILAAERRALSFEERTPRAAVSAMLGLLAETGEKIAAAYTATGGKNLITDCRVILHAPLANSVAVRISSDFKTETPVTESMIEELARKAFSENTGLEKSEIFESSVTRVELNGYQTSEPSRESAHRIEVSALASACNQSLRTSIGSALEKVFPHAKVVMRSGLRAAVSVVRETLGRSEDFLIVDVTGDAITFIRLDGNMSLEHEVMPEGYRTILKKIAGKGLPEDKLSVLRMLGRDDVSGETSDELKTALSQFESELLRECGETLGALAGQRRLPEVVLLSDHDLAPWLSGFFSRIDFTQFTITLRPFNVHILSVETLSRDVQSVGPKPDVGLCVAAALVNRERGGVEAL